MPHKYTIEMYCWEENGTKYGFTKEELESRLVSYTPPITEENPNPVATMEPAINHLPISGKWFTISLKENFYRSDRNKAEQSLHVIDRATGRTEYQTYRTYDAFAAQAISAWDFRYEHDETKKIPITEEGIGMLPDKVGSVLVEEVWMRYNDAPAFFRGVPGPTA